LLIGLPGIPLDFRQCAVAGYSLNLLRRRSMIGKTAHRGLAKTMRNAFGRKAGGLSGIMY
jgi:hypothetical protein